MSHTPEQEYAARFNWILKVCMGFKKVILKFHQIIPGSGNVAVLELALDDLIEEIRVHNDKCPNSKGRSRRRTQPKAG